MPTLDYYTVMNPTHVDVGVRPLGGMDDGSLVAINIVTGEFETEIILDQADIDEIVTTAAAARATQQERADADA